MNETPGAQAPKEPSTLIKLIESPIKFFGLIALTCDSVFGICATVLKDTKQFTYCIHMFIAIVSLLALIAIWCPGVLYHPREIEDRFRDKIPYKPWVPTVFCFAGLVLYMAYQIVGAKLGIDR